MCRGIVTGDEVRKLAFYIREQAAGTNAEKGIIKPLVAQLFFHQN